MKYYILGKFPPPLGGVSVYCFRKLELLKSQKEDVTAFDTSSKKSILKLLLVAWCSRALNKKFEIEINVSHPLVIFALILSRLTPYIIFVDHNSSRRYQKESYSKTTYLYFIKKIKKIKIVNSQLAEFYKRAGVYDNSKFEVITPFLKPSSKEIRTAAEGFNQEIKDVISSDKEIVFCSAWQPINTESEPDLYGLNQTLDIYEKLIPNFPNYHFLLLIGELTNSSFSNFLEKRCKGLGQFSNFTFVSGGYQQIGFLDNTKLLIRLSKTDGDSVSIREALHFNVNVIASDVCVRPYGVINVSLEDIDQIIKKCTWVLEK